MSRGPFRIFFLVGRLTARCPEVGLDFWFFEVSRGRIRNLIFDVQKLDWTSGGEVSRGWFRFVCVYDFCIPHQVRKA